MAVQSQTPYIEHVGNGVTNTFNLEFDCDDKNHLVVWVDENEPAAGAWDLSKGAIVFNSIPKAGAVIKVLRNTPFRRDRDYQSYDNSFRPPAVNKDFDWIWWKLQELGVADWILGARIDALKNYVDRKDDELKDYLLEEIRKQGVALDQLEDYYNYLMERLAQIAVDKGWDASFVVDGSENQKQINDKSVQYVNDIVELRKLKPRKNGALVVTAGYRKQGVGSGTYVFNNTLSVNDDGGEYIKTIGVDGAWVLQPRGSQVSPELFGAYGDLIADDAASLRKCSAFAEKYNLNIKGESVVGYYFASDVTIYNSFDVEGLYFNASETRYGSLYIQTRKKPESIALSTLGGLSEGSPRITGFPLGAVGKYIRFSSETAILTERNNANQKQYYYKNTTVNLITYEGDISPGLDMAFSYEDDVKVEVIPFESRIKVRIGKVGTVGVGSATTGIIGIRRDSTDLHIDSMESEVNFKTLIGVQANNSRLYGALRDTNYEGLGYAISIANTCDTFIYDMKATRGRTELDGRHGSNVFVYNSKFKRAGTHWGNNYTFVNCTIESVSWAGRDLSIEGGTVHSGVTNRTDVCLSTGRFYANNVTTHSIVFLTSSGAVPADFFSTPRRFFDEVIISNLRCTGNMQTLFGFGISPNADIKAPSHIVIDTVYAPNATRMALVVYPLDNALSFPSPQTFRVENIRHGGVCKVTGRGFGKYASTSAYNAYFNNCGRIEIQADSNYFQKLEVGRSEVVSARQINTKIVLGKWLFINSTIKRDPSISTALFNIASPKGFQGCEYDGDMTGINTLGPVLFSLNCRATVGSINYPTPLKAGYVNPAYYIDDTVPAI